MTKASNFVSTTYPFALFIKPIPLNKDLLIFFRCYSNSFLFDILLFRTFFASPAPEIECIWKRNRKIEQRNILVSILQLHYCVSWHSALAYVRQVRKKRIFCKFAKTQFSIPENFWKLSHFICAHFFHK
jgi:hypothetical protein